MRQVIALAGEHDQIVRKQITPYSFRHLYISELLMRGIEPFKVSKLAGTSQQEIERTYGHFFHHDLAQVSEEIDQQRQRERLVEARRGYRPPLFENTP